MLTSLAQLITLPSFSPNPLFPYLSLRTLLILQPFLLLLYTQNCMLLVNHPVYVRCK